MSPSTQSLTDQIERALEDLARELEAIVERDVVAYRAARAVLRKQRAA